MQFPKWTSPRSLHKRNKSSGELDAISYDHLPAAAKEFEVTELTHLKHLFHELARRSPNPTISREHFLEFVQLPGLHGEQLFRAIDTNHSGVIDFEEFVTGLAITCRGDRQTKMKFLFEMYDLQGDGSVSNAELRTMVNNLPRNMSTHGLEAEEQTVREAADEARAVEEAGGDDASSSGDRPSAEVRFAKRVSKDKSYLDFTNDAHVDSAFETCDLNHDGRLSWDQFQLWLDRTPAVMKFFDEALARTLQPAEATKSGASLSLRSTANGSTHGGVGGGGGGGGAGTTNNKKKNLRLQKAPPGGGGGAGEAEEPAEFAGPLFKVGATIGRMTKRHFSLVGNCLYYYQKAGDDMPRGLVFLGGCTCDRVDDDHGAGFRIQHVDAARLGERPTTLYAANKIEREAWVDVVQSAIGQSSRGVDALYDLKEKLGDGCFAQVYDAVDRATGKHVAVKKILKAKTPDESQEDTDKRREMFRNEVAIMRLTRHKHILSLIAVFEDKTHIHLVTPRMATDLNKRLVQTKCYGEDAALRVAARLYDAVAYLHQLGIVHRDLKPENILCDHDEAFDSLRIGDFGISQILRPDEHIIEPAGTMDYCAPEVFVREGAGFPADVWSVGIISHLVLVGSLPFTGESNAETIGHILEGEYQTAKEVWDSQNPLATDFIKAILHPTKEKRLTAKQALNHDWIKSHVKHTLKQEGASSRDPLLPIPVKLSSLTLDSDGELTDRLSESPTARPSEDATFQSSKDSFSSLNSANAPS